MAKKKKHDIKGWLTPQHALALVAETVGKDRAKAVIYEHLRGGMVIAACKRTSVEEDGEVEVATDGPFPLPAAFWIGLDNADFWEGGFARFTQRRDGGVQIVRCYGLLFAPKGIKLCIPEEGIAATKPAIPIPPAKHPGGRPPKAFWDDLWVEICRQLYTTGQLVPTKQADIEKAMLSWAAEHGHELSEQAARSRARLLMKALAQDNN